MLDGGQDRAGDPDIAMCALETLLLAVEQGCKARTLQLMPDGGFGHADDGNAPVLKARRGRDIVDQG